MYLLGFSTRPNAPVHPPGPLQRRGVARNKNAGPVKLYVRFYSAAYIRAKEDVDDARRSSLVR